MSRNLNSISTLDLDLWKNIEINSKIPEVKFQDIQCNENILKFQYKVDYTSTQELTSPTYFEMQNQVNILKREFIINKRFLNKEFYS